MSTLAIRVTGLRVGDITTCYTDSLDLLRTVRAIRVILRDGNL